MEWAIALLALAVAAKVVTQVAHRRTLAARYADSPFRDAILSGKIQVGMTVLELTDAWGQPAAIEERVLKTKVVHTYKYGQRGARSFRQRVRIENGIVVGWTSS